MNDDSTINSKGDCIKTLSNVELRKWLKFHNQDVSTKYESTEKQFQHKRLLLNGLETELNPNEKLKTIINVTNDPIRINNSEEVLPILCNKAIENVLVDKKYKNRYNAGMHPITLLAEKRRKIILNALYTIKPSQNNDELPINNIIHNSMSQNDLNTFETTFNNMIINKKNNNILISHPNDTNINKNHLLNNNNNNNQKFQPKWEHYNTMRSRWSYIKPQITDLIDHKSILAPTSNQKYLKIDNNTIIRGNLNDIIYYQTIKHKKINMENNIKNKRNQIELNKTKALNTYYIPNPCVRY